MRQGNNVLLHNARPHCSGYNNSVSVLFRTPLRVIRATVVIMQRHHISEKRNPLSWLRR